MALSIFDEATMKLRVEGCRFPSWRAWLRRLDISHADANIVGFVVALDDADAEEERETTALVSVEMNAGLGRKARTSTILVC
jgi:hypothetical protein